MQLKMLFSGQFWLINDSMIHMTDSYFCKVIFMITAKQGSLDVFIYFIDNQLLPYDTVIT